METGISGRSATTATRPGILLRLFGTLERIPRRRGRLAAPLTLRQAGPDLSGTDQRWERHARKDVRLERDSQHELQSIPDDGTTLHFVSQHYSDRGTFRQRQYDYNREVDAYGNVVQSQVSDYQGSPTGSAYLSEIYYLPESPWAQNYIPLYIFNRLGMSTLTSTSSSLTLANNAYDTTGGSCGGLDFDYQ